MVMCVKFVSFLFFVFTYHRCSGRVPNASHPLCCKELFERMAVTVDPRVHFYYYGLTLVPARLRITSITLCVMKSFIHSENFMVQPLKFGSG